MAPSPPVAKPKTDAEGNPVTEGQAWQAASMTVKRDILTPGAVKVMVRTKGVRPGDVVVMVQRLRQRI